MKVTADCIPCYLNQCLNAMDKGGWPEEKRAELLVGLLPVIGSLDKGLTPAENSTFILHKVVEMMGGGDPFAKAKKESNDQALQYLTSLRQAVLKAEDPLMEALRFSVAGNVVDLGIFDDYDLEAAVRDAVTTDFSINDYPAFRSALSKAKKVMIIGDNSGEIVFDRLLVGALNNLGVEVIYGVKASFILNDATPEDARQAGIDREARVVTNGNNFLGTIDGHCSKEFLAEIQECDLIISKGQANYESLEGTELAGEKTYFLLKAKCPVVAKHLGVEYGDIVFVKNSSKKNGPS